MALEEIAKSGDRQKTLEALRDRIAREIDETNSARDVAALSRQLTEVLDDLAALPNREKRSAADEIAERRRRRRSGPTPESRPAEQ